MARCFCGLASSKKDFADRRAGIPLDDSDEIGVGVFGIANPSESIPLSLG
jgi:hypothetical protein